jgi:hypothetical protein
MNDRELSFFFMMGIGKYTNFVFKELRRVVHTMCSLADERVKVTAQVGNEFTFGERWEFLLFVSCR